MGVELKGQALALLLAAAMGWLLGVLYDLLRPVRRRTGRVMGAALDMLFCLAAGAAVFTYAMGAGSGRLGLWELTAALLGFLLYMHTLSGPLLRVFNALLELLCRLVGALKKTAARAVLLTKKALERMRGYARKVREKFPKKSRPPEAAEEEQTCVER